MRRINFDSLSFLENKKYVFEKLRKIDLDFEIYTGTEFDDKDLKDYWKESKSENGCYVYLLKQRNEKGKSSCLDKYDLIGCVYFKIMENFYYSHYQEELQKIITQIPPGPYFYLSRLLVQENHQKMKFGKVLMYFLFHFLIILKDFINSFLFYGFTDYQKYKDFYNSWRWDINLGFPIGYKQIQLIGRYY